MSVKTAIFSILLGLATMIDLVLGTSDYPKMLMVMCAIVCLYELVSPYVYTPS
jgi:hypothetical protein